MKKRSGGKMKKKYTIEVSEMEYALVDLLRECFRCDFIDNTDDFSMTVIQAYEKDIMGDKYKVVELRITARKEEK